MVIRSRRGLSLVELLVVVGLLAVLLAVLIPAVSRARTSAVRTTCLSNLHQVSAGLNAYANDNRGQLPVAYVYGDGDDPPAIPGVNFENILKPVWGEFTLLFRWPADYAEPPHMAGLPYLANARPFVSPREPVDGGTFVLPHRLIGFTPRRGTMAGSGVLGIGSYLYEYVPGPAEVAANPYLASFAGSERSTLAGPSPATRSIAAEFTLYQGHGLGSPDYSFPWFHGSGGNVLYLDGHAVWTPVEAVWPLHASVGTHDILGRYYALLTALDR